MLYELHITINPDSNLREWELFCESKGYKPLLIELHDDQNAEQIANPQQMMFAAIFEGTHEEAVKWREATAGLVHKDFQIIRQKLEVPLDKSQPFVSPPYYEIHVKALIDPECLGGNLRDAAHLNWRASRNALFTHDQGYEKWYFTKRFYPDKRGLSERFSWWPYQWRSAATYFHTEYADCFNILGGVCRMEMEAVVMDTNPELDEGWA